jgi:DNA-binding response OmpR family regulator
MVSKPFRVVGSEDGANRPSRRALRILIADDDRDAATMLAVLLRDEGHEVNVALRGDEAMDLVRLMRPDALILDINMPGMSGYAIAREIKERYAVAAPLMIGVSGVWTKTSERLLGQAVGFDHYLVKPYDSAQLLALLEPLRAAPARGSGSGDT